MAEQHKWSEPTRMEHRGPEPFGGMTIEEGFKGIARLMNAYFPAPPDQGYVGNRCGWYPAKPKRKRTHRP